MQCPADLFRDAVRDDNLINLLADRVDEVHPGCFQTGKAAAAFERRALGRKAAGCVALNFSG